MTQKVASTSPSSRATAGPRAARPILSCCRRTPRASSFPGRGRARGRHLDGLHRPAVSRPATSSWARSRSPTPRWSPTPATASSWPRASTRCSSARPSVGQAPYTGCGDGVGGRRRCWTRQRDGVIDTTGVAPGIYTATMTVDRRGLRLRTDTVKFVVAGGGAGESRSEPTPDESPSSDTEPGVFATDAGVRVDVRGRPAGWPARGDALLGRARQRLRPVGPRPRAAPRSRPPAAPRPADRDRPASPTPRRVPGPSVRCATAPCPSPRCRSPS